MRSAVSLTIDRLSKTFGSTQALNQVSFTVEDGQIHGLLGENGSGKSTLVKILAGVYTADPGGTVNLGTTTMRADAITPDRARLLGMRFVHQNSAVFPQMTVAENIAVSSVFPARFGKIRWSALEVSTRQLLDRYEIHAEPDNILGELRPADQTMVAVARALRDTETATVLVLDEPTASLPEHEVRMLIAALRRCANHGQTILYVSHRIDEILELTDAVTVLRDGQHIITRSSKGLAEGRLVEYIVGRPIETVFAESPPAPESRCRLSVTNLTAGPLSGVTFQVSQGEVVGVAGLLGSGQGELLRALFGAPAAESGEISLDGASVTIRSPEQAKRLGIGYVPANRERDGVFPDLSVRENLTSANISAYWRWLLRRYRHERRETARAITEFNIRTETPESPISLLSGGNQQKVILARWLIRKPKVLLLDEPTQGVDVGARADVYATIRHAVRAGMSVLLTSSDFDELAHASDRVLVIRDGQIAAELAGADLTRARITELVYSTGD